jgi:short-subunit dehydrogenase
MVRLKPLREQTIIITGASSGIGLATAQAAVRRGASALLVARNGQALEAVARGLANDAGEVRICVVDVAETGSAKRIAQVALKEFGGFDCWVSCAAVSSYGTLEQIGLVEQRRTMDVNYFGMLEGNLAALEHLRTRSAGSIINVGSILSDRAVIEQPGYCAAKAAVRSLTESLRMDIERESLPISVTLIKPGGIHTPFPEHARNHMSKTPRIPPPLYSAQLVADAILFAAEHPRRQIYVGGLGFGLSVLARLFPRTTDLIMEASFIRGQQSDERGDSAARDNLFEPKLDGRIDGTQQFRTRQSSLFLQAQKYPAVAVALVAGLAVSATALRSRKMDRGRAERRELAREPTG